jgi:tetratricopeptide (TPR) repeat protein
VPAPPADAPPEVLATREEIIARAAALDTEDYFVMLGASQEDSEEQLRSRYFALAKKYHSDRMPPGLEDLKETLDYVFTNLTEAYQTLTDGDKRRRYLELLREGSGTPADQRKIANIVDNAMNLQKAEVCLRRKNYEEAERFCRLAAEADPDDGEAIGLLAWIQLHRREPGLPVTDLVARLRQAIDLVPRSEKVNFYLGTALKRSGEPMAAVVYFRKAAEINPRNVDAIREVRLYEMRRDRGSTMPPEAKKDEKVGIFGKLFGKK